MIYLLDLNYTLVGNSPRRGDPPIRPFIRQIEQEEYRQWLVELLRPHKVILITARPDRYREVTLERIKEKTGWEPVDAYFAQIQARPPQIKEHLLKTHIFPKYGNNGYFALESNPYTREMYKGYGIEAVRVTDQELMKC
ncbi:MAG: hypothetical protein AB3N64_08600 [Puniceicoccaceae bacterium]